MTEILVVTPNYLPTMGGVETHIYETTYRLPALGFSPRILTADRTRSLPATEEIRGTPVQRVPAYPSNRDWLFAPGAVGAVSRTDAALVHIQSVATAVAPLAMIGAVRSRKPFVVTFHTGGHSSALRRLLRSTQWRTLGPLLRRATKLVAVSEFEIELFARALHIPRSRFALIPNGSDLPKPLCSGRPAVTDGLKVVSVGRLEKYKGHHRVIEAIPELRRRCPGASLTIVGSGPYDAELHKQATSLGLDECVSFETFPPSDRQGLADLLASSHVVALLSDYEAHPLTVMEALAVGTPVLASDTTGFAELGRANLIRTIPSRSSPADVATAIAATSETSPPVLPLPSWDDCAEQLAEVYRAALNLAS
jgi:glycosyltransferase involved in cell wall biosynthesis